VREPARAQGLEAQPAVVGAQLHGEQVAELAVEVGEVDAGVGECGDGEVGEPGEAGGEQAQGDALAGAGGAGDEREAALAGVGVLHAPAEVLDGGGGEQGLGRQLGAEGVPLEAIEGEQLAVHGVLSSGSKGR